MNTQARMFIGALLAAVVALGVVLGIVLATDGGSGNGTTSPNVTDNGDGFMGMMAAMGNLDSNTMLQRMRDVLGEDGYQRMLAHFREHQNGTATTNDPAIDTMMHQMMDGMLRYMPMDPGGMMPGDQNAHHDTPGPGMMPSR